MMSFSDKAEGQKLVTATTNFAFKLYKELSVSKVGDNVFMSPASISLAMAMTYLGAKNDTAKQISDVLGLADVNPDQLHGLFSELQQSLTSSGSCTLDIASKLYPQVKYTILQEYIEATSKYYKTDVERVDFAGDGEGARNTINEWVESKTHKKITDLLKPGTIDPLTRLILVNAVYFKGDWDVKFDPERTEEADFRLAEGGSLKVPLMYTRRDLDHGICRKLKDVKALRLPYAEGKFSFVALLPEHPEGITHLENNLTVDQLVNYRDTFKMTRGGVIAHMPRFKLEDSFDLSVTLAKLGMRDLFSPGADLSGIDGTRDLFVSKVIHKSYLEVNEEGSEAAAATAVVIVKKSLGSSPKLFHFRADHPFLFFISDDETGAIVFMGKYARPC